MITVNSSKQYHLISALIIVLLCFCLFSVDKDTHSISDLFKPGNLVALLIYFVPTWLLCYALYKMFERRNNKNSFALALGIGIPGGFAIVIIVLSFAMGRL